MDKANDNKSAALFSKKSNFVCITKKNRYFCHMKTQTVQPHPISLNLQRIKDEGIVVLDNAHGLPTIDKPFVSPDYVICIGHRGHIDLMYDDFSDYSEKHTVAVIFPNHSLREVRKTNDYLATLIVVHASVLNDPMLQIINQMRYRYKPHPCVKLDRREYRNIMNVVEIMHETVRVNLPDRRALMTRQLEFLLRLLGIYRKNKFNEASHEKRISMRFHYGLEKHFRQHRDIGFYANLANLTPKYFSTVIQQETGHTAAYWIHTTIVAEAKMLLHVRHDLSVQAIADILGFDEQAAFSRYFKRETGMSPTEFRALD